MLRRAERRDDRQDDRGGPLSGGGGGKNHYQMRQKMISIGDDFWIENDHGQKVFKVDGKALRVRQTLILEDAHGARAATRSRSGCCGSRTRWKSKTPAARRSPW